jgi:uncharacterized membrane protein YhiD involved in acid resistance
MIDAVSMLPHQLPVVWRALLLLPSAAVLAGMLGFVRPIRRQLVPRSFHVIQTQVLLAIVGAVIMMVVGESLARAFAIVGAAGLVRYRAHIDDPKDAGVLLVALAIGLASGHGLLLLATVLCAFVIAVLWILESIEPADRSQFDLRIATKDPTSLRPHVEHALRKKGISFDLWGSSATELRYEVAVPLDQRVEKLTKMIRKLDGREATSIEWRLKRQRTEK